MRVAFVHEWLVKPAGSEKVLEAMLSLFPEAPVYTLVYDPKGFEASPIARHPVHTSFLDRLPLARRKYPLYLPLMPMAVEAFDLSGYDLVVSSAHAVAKGVITGPDQLHIAYVHTPVRYAWDLEGEYLRGLPASAKPLARLVLHYLRLWDQASALRPDLLLANSRFVARRVAKVYRREAQVLYPPVEVDRFRPREDREEFYLTVSRLVPYKRVDLIVEAFRRLERPLVVIGDGPERKRLEEAAMGVPNIRFLGRQPDAVLRNHMERCRAFVFAALEDFGIAPVEAMAAGAPVIAYGRGGVAESVVEGETGVFFPEQTPEALVEAVLRFEEKAGNFHPQRSRERAEAFSKERFLREFSKVVEEASETFRRGASPAPRG